tara:strand:- start:37557 stop:37874 length:318 start_codon:yes stop_codon:yes gene_type:complete
MKINTQLVVLAALLIPLSGTAADGRDCLLEGTVHKAPNDEPRVKFHSMEKYDSDSRCRVRNDEKLQFKLPADPRLEAAPSGSAVKYRYRNDNEGQPKAELISVGA